MSAGATGRRLPGADDTGLGLTMFVIFTAAALIVTGAVALLALVGSWWMLAVAFALHVAMTSVVTLAISHALDSRTVATYEAVAARS